MKPAFYMAKTNKVLTEDKTIPRFESVVTQTSNLQMFGAT